MEEAQEIATEKYGEPIEPDHLRPTTPPKYTVCVDHMKEDHNKCVKCFRVIIDGATSAENPFKNRDVSAEISKEVFKEAGRLVPELAE